MKGAVVPTEFEPGEYISTIFIVPKKNGKYRPVINLRFLNHFVHYDHFKQETFKVIVDLIQENDFFTSIDLSDAYFSVPIAAEFQKYLKFSWKGQLYKFVVLPFGLKSAPYVFTKILTPVYAWFRLQNIHCSYYMDDSISMNSSNSLAQGNTNIMVDTLQHLGFDINYKKSVLVPTQRIAFFGFIINSVAFMIYLPEDKVVKIDAKAEALRRAGRVVIRDLASFIGLIVSSFYAILEAQLYYRALERNKIQGLGPECNFDNKVPLSNNSILELEWWKENVRLKNGRHIRFQNVDVQCRTDASFSGWGALDLKTGIFAQGRWTSVAIRGNINCLELLAIFQALQAFYSNRVGIHIEVQSDNVAAVTYINDMGGMCSLPLDYLAKDIWNWCLERNIVLTAGISNTADFFSRNFSDSTEWILKKDIFSRVRGHFFVPEVDLFASRLNAQVDNYVSWFPEPGVIQHNAFTFSWQHMRPYIFPPFNMIGKVMNKILKDRVENAILIFPFWKAQSWFPLVLENISSFPVRLPPHKDLPFHTTVPFIHYTSQFR